MFNCVYINKYHATNKLYQINILYNTNIVYDQTIRIHYERTIYAQNNKVYTIHVFRVKLDVYSYVA